MMARMRHGRRAWAQGLMRRRARQSGAGGSWSFPQLRGLARRIGEFAEDDLADLAADLAAIHIRAAEMDAAPDPCVVDFLGQRGEFVIAARHSERSRGGHADVNLVIAKVAAQDSFCS